MDAAVKVWGAGWLFGHRRGATVTEEETARTDAPSAEMFGVSDGGFQLLRQPPPVLPGRAIGSSAPDFALGDVEGGVVTLDMLRDAGRPILLLFVDPRFPPVHSFLPEVAGWHGEYADRMTVAVISRTELRIPEGAARTGRGPRVLVQRDRDLAAAFNLHSPLCAVVLCADGRLGSAPAIGAAAIRALVARTLKVTIDIPLPQVAQDVEQLRREAVARGNPYAPKVGDPAPRFALPDRVGAVIELSAFHGRPIVLLFWDPECTFCCRLRAELIAWEAQRGESESPLVLVVTGRRERADAIMLGTTVLLDPAFTTARRYGAAGTPMAVLVDADGRIGSEMAAGAPAILELLQGIPPPGLS